MWKLFGGFPSIFDIQPFILQKNPYFGNNLDVGQGELLAAFETELKRSLHITISGMAMLLFAFLGLHAQTVIRKPTIVDARIALKGAEVQGSYIVITYEIPYSGMVEIRLFDENGQKIWQNQYADTFGKNKIVLKASKFNPGQTYAYQLNYKRDQVTQNFVVPPPGYN